MSEHVCEENIEDNYENFDIIENDLMKARPQPSIAHHQHQQRFMEAEFFRREEKPMVLDKFDEKFYSHESKVALNSDVDLIKTTKVPYVKPELMLEDDKVSGKSINMLQQSHSYANNFIPLFFQLFEQLALGYHIIQTLKINQDPPHQPI